MTASGQGVYLPPHLRKRAPTPSQVRTDIKLGDFIGVGSPPVSVRSVQGQALP